MSFRFRPQLDALEVREVPASLSALLSDGSVVSGQFSAPAGVDPAQASQELTISDLTVVKGGHKYNVQADATAIYASGVLVAVRAGAEGQDTLKFQDDGTVTDGQQSAAVAFDGADTQSTFTLPDGTVGAISYQIPWSQVDPSQSSQSLTPTAFNLNIAGRNYAYAGATAGYFITAPTLAFANGALTGAAFALDLTGTRAPYSSISVSNGVASAIDAATGAVLNAPVADTQATPFAFINFEPLGKQPNAYVLKIKFTAADGSTFEQSYNIGANNTPAEIANAIFNSIPQASDTISPPNSTYYSGWFLKLNDAKTGFYVYGYRPKTVTTPNGPPPQHAVTPGTTAVAVGLPAASQPSVIEPQKK